MENRKFYFLSIIIVFFSLVSCKKNEKVNAIDHNKGIITILADDSYKGVTEAIADAYMINYPETNVKVEVMKEDLAFLELLNRRTKLIVMSRELNEKERKEYDDRVGLKFQPARFAADAVAFIVSKNDFRNEISINEIEKMLNSDEKNLIFDGTNSANLNFVAQKFKKKPSELKFSIINGNENVIEQLQKFPNKIGVVSYNTFSRPYSEKEKALRENVKILSIVENEKSYAISPESLRDMQYPFTRVLYMLTDEPNFGIANGIMRFACTQKGQIVVQKEGLQPYYLYKREVEMR